MRSSRAKHHKGNLIGSPPLAPLHWPRMPATGGDTHGEEANLDGISRQKKCYFELGRASDTAEDIPKDFFLFQLSPQLPYVTL